MPSVPALPDHHKLGERYSPSFGKHSKRLHVPTRKRAEVGVVPAVFIVVAGKVHLDGIGRIHAVVFMHNAI